MRGTGRTKRMCLKAVHRFLEEENVAVLGFNHYYASNLCRQCKDILSVLHLDDKIDLDLSDRILYHDKIMWFTSYDNFTDNQKYNEANFEVIGDHYYPIAIARYNI